VRTIEQTTRKLLAVPLNIDSEDEEANIRQIIIHLYYIYTYIPNTKLTEQN